MNAGHLLGIALLIGSVIPMDLRLLGLMRGGTSAGAVALLRPVAITGLILAVFCGTLLFATQATDYIHSRWFGVKMALLAMAVANAVPHLFRNREVHPTRTNAVLSLMLWPTILVCGRMIGFA